MSETGQQPPLIYLIAGEPSGDNLAADLIEGIRSECPEAMFAGVGGPAMKTRGLDSLFPMSDLSVMGIAEILPRLGLLLKRIRETADDVLKLRPDVVVTIDSPDFSFRVAKRLKGLGIPLIHYVAPSVWAWRPGRAAKIAGLYDHLLTLLPFEPPYFEKEGLPTTFVGHPVMKNEKGDGKKFRRSRNIDDAAPLLCLLPGSRRSEISRLLPVFLETFEKLQGRFPDFQAVIPAVSHLEHEIRAAIGDRAGIMIATGGDKPDAMAASTLALAASGTIALELAVEGVPSVIAYKLNPLTASVARRLIKIPYKSLVNILLEREVMPERIQERCTPEELYEELLTLLTDEKRRKGQSNAFLKVRARLSPANHDGENIAAKQVLRLARSRHCAK